ncbi:hypothetical protein DCAR_0728183 [Daucus carota subsp. sativus]|uniref:Uncharacterized protein n=1 Tax=Daucus carota subsp. sativus TaxID=79200 RepID=A0A175YBA0_DAUCS|nr:PREDICTED: uncharacterized protein LOC108192516 [Daucus carota subsp. sativus]WOH08736.1 hypothetical protein DCAR_0728183 [Daucus carota subsp. sativus]
MASNFQLENLQKQLENLQQLVDLLMQKEVISNQQIMSLQNDVTVLQNTLLNNEQISQQIWAQFSNEIKSFKIDVKADIAGVKADIAGVINSDMYEKIVNKMTVMFNEVYRRLPEPVAQSRAENVSSRAQNVSSSTPQNF